MTWEKEVMWPSELRATILDFLEFLDCLFTETFAEWYGFDSLEFKIKAHGDSKAAHVVVNPNTWPENDFVHLRLEFNRSIYNGEINYRWEPISVYVHATNVRIAAYEFIHFFNVYTSGPADDVSWDIWPDTSDKNKSSLSDLIENLLVLPLP